MVSEVSDPQHKAGSGLRATIRRRTISRAESSVDRIIGWAAPALLISYGITLTMLGTSPVTILAFGLLIIGLAGLLIARLTRNLEVAGSVFGVIGAVAVMAWVIQPLRITVGDHNPISAASYTMTVFAAALPYIPTHPRNNRAITGLLGQVGVLLAVAVSNVAPAVAVVFALLWVLAVGMIRSGGIHLWRVLRARLRSGVVTSYHKRMQRAADGAGGGLLDDQRAAQGAAAETETGRVLAGLDQDRWAVLHSRAIPGSTADLDHLVFGLPGVFLIDTKDWAGKITEETVTSSDGEPQPVFTLGGSTEALTDKLGPVLYEAGQVRDRLGLDTSTVHIVLCFTSRMKLPEKALRLDVDGWDLTLVNQRNLMAVLDVYPDVAWRTPRRLGRQTDPDAATRKASLRFVKDLAVAADFAFPPAN